VPLIASRHPFEEIRMNAFHPLGSLTLSTVLVATAAIAVIAMTTPAEAAPAPGAASTPSALQLRQLAADVQGQYTLADGRTLRVWREGRALLAQLGDAPAVTLQPRAPDRLVTADGRMELAFRQGPDGRAWAVSLVQSR
jgi:hypothetical protein